MRTIPARLRVAAAQGLALPLDEGSELVTLAWSELPPTPSDRARAAVLARPEMAPVPPRLRGRAANRQVNFRLTEGDYLDLATAAELVGAKPSQLASLLVRSGVQRMIQARDDANRQAS